MAGERKRGGRGRPRDLAKLEAILDAAYALFLERGVAATTMDAVAERACVSKMTVYANFQDKPALLSAVFDRTSHQSRRNRRGDRHPAGSHPNDPAAG